MPLTSEGLVLLIFCCVNLAFIYQLNEKSSNMDAVYANMQEIYFQIQDEITELKIAQKQNLRHEVNRLKVDLTDHISNVNSELHKITTDFNDLTTNFNNMNAQQQQLNSEMIQVNKKLKSYLKVKNNKHHITIETKPDNIFIEDDEASADEVNEQINVAARVYNAIYNGINSVLVKIGVRSSPNIKTQNITDTMNNGTHDVDRNSSECEDTSGPSNKNTNNIENDRDIKSINDNHKSEYSVALIEPDFEYKKVRRRIIFGIKEDVCSEQHIDIYATDIGEYFKQDLKNKLTKFDANILEDDLNSFGLHIENSIKKKDSQLEYLFNFVSNDERTFYGKINIYLKKNGEKEEEITVKTTYYFDLFYVKM
eukprot:47320_1